MVMDLSSLEICSLDGPTPADCVSNGLTTVVTLPIQE